MPLLLKLNQVLHRAFATSYMFLQDREERQRSVLAFWLQGPGLRGVGEAPWSRVPTAAPYRCIIRPFLQSAALGCTARLGFHNCMLVLRRRPSRIPMMFSVCAWLRRRRESTRVRAPCRTLLDSNSAAHSTKLSPAVCRAILLRLSSRPGT